MDPLAQGLDEDLEGWSEPALFCQPVAALSGAVRPDFVKVDGVIVRKLLAALAAEAKLKAVLRVDEVMGFKVIAEMVEEQDILVRLKALGVGYAQGFGIQQLLPTDKLAR